MIFLRRVFIRMHLIYIHYTPTHLQSRGAPPRPRSCLWRWAIMVSSVVGSNSTVVWEFTRRNANIWSAVRPIIHITQRTVKHTLWLRNSTSPHLQEYLLFCRSKAGREGAAVLTPILNFELTYVAKLVGSFDGPAPKSCGLYDVFLVNMSIAVGCIQMAELVSIPSLLHFLSLPSTGSSKDWLTM